MRLRAFSAGTTDASRAISIAGATGLASGLEEARADIENIGAVLQHSFSRMRQRRLGREIFPAVRKGVFRDVEDAENFHALNQMPK